MAVTEASISRHTTASSPRPHIQYIIEVKHSDGTKIEVGRRYSEASALRCRFLSGLTSDQRTSFSNYTRRSVMLRLFPPNVSSSPRSFHLHGPTTSSSQSGRTGSQHTSPNCCRTRRTQQIQSCLTSLVALLCRLPSVSRMRYPRPCPGRPH